jgi:putative ABC transport system substrate-binding protein
LARPGGNVTGLSGQSTDLIGKRLELFREIVPALRRLAIIGDSSNRSVRLEVDEVQRTARTLGIEVVMITRPQLPEMPSVDTVDAVMEWLDHADAS